MILIHGGSENQDENEEESEKLNGHEGQGTVYGEVVSGRDHALQLRTLPKLGHVPTLSPPSSGTLDISISLSRP